jgi:hypothetical protein
MSDDDQDDNAANKNYQRRVAQELAEFDTPQARYQAVLDRQWQAKLDADADWDDGYVEVAGFREPRYRPSCHVGKHDPDFGQH